MQTVIIIQLNPQTRLPERAFTFRRFPAELAAFKEGTERGYNMANTKVMLDGRYWFGAAK